MTEYTWACVYAGETRSLPPKAKKKWYVCDFKSKNPFWNIWLWIACLLQKQTDILCQYKKEKPVQYYGISIFENTDVFLPVANLQIQWPKHKAKHDVAASWLSVSPWATHPSALSDSGPRLERRSLQPLLATPRLAFTPSQTATILTPATAFQPAACRRLRQPAVAQGLLVLSLHRPRAGLPGTTPVTSPAAPPSCRQPGQGPIRATRCGCLTAPAHHAAPWLQPERALTLLTAPRYTFSPSACL